MLGKKHTIVGQRTKKLLKTDTANNLKADLGAFFTGNAEFQVDKEDCDSGNHEHHDLDHAHQYDEQCPIIMGKHPASVVKFDRSFFSAK